MKWRNVFVGGALLGLLAAAAPARAVTITGSFGIGGSISYQNLGAGGALAGLDFDLTLPPPTGPTGAFFQITAASGYFAGLGMTPGGTGSILNITNMSPAPVNYTFAPVGPNSVPNFLSAFSQASGLHFDMTAFPPQSGALCPSLPTCAEGPFLLTQSASGTRLDFDILGKFVNGADSGLYDGSFSMTFAGKTIADLGAALAAGQNLVCNGGTPTAPIPQPCSFNANFSPITAIPEPATLLTFGLGSLALARFRRKKNN